MRTEHSLYDHNALRTNRRRQWARKWEGRRVALLAACQVRVERHLVVDKSWNLVLMVVERFRLPALLDLNSVLYHPHVVYPSGEFFNIVKKFIYIIITVLLTPLGILLCLLVCLLIICPFHLPRATAVGCASMSGSLLVKDLSYKLAHRGIRSIGSVISFNSALKNSVVIKERSPIAYTFFLGLIIAFIFSLLMHPTLMVRPLLMAYSNNAFFLLTTEWEVIGINRPLSH